MSETRCCSIWIFTYYIIAFFTFIWYNLTFLYRYCFNILFFFFSLHSVNPFDIFIYGIYYFIEVYNYKNSLWTVLYEYSSTQQTVTLPEHCAWWGIKVWGVLNLKKNSPFCPHFLYFQFFLLSHVPHTGAYWFSVWRGLCKIGFCWRFSSLHYRLFKKNRQNIRERVTGSSVFCSDEMPHLRTQQQLRSL